MKNYDLYCFESRLDNPSIMQALESIEGPDNFGSTTEESRSKKIQIAKGIMAINPKFQLFDNDVLKRSETTAEDEKSKIRFGYLELRIPTDIEAIVITIFEKNIWISIPMHYSGYAAAKIFQEIQEYLKLINRIMGYYVYDPQSQSVFNPHNGILELLNSYIWKTRFTGPFKGKKRKFSSWWKSLMHKIKIG